MRKLRTLAALIATIVPAIAAGQQLQSQSPPHNEDVVLKRLQRPVFFGAVRACFDSI